MLMHTEAGRIKPPKHPNHLPHAWLVPDDSAGPCRRGFLAAIKERRDKHPFIRVSAYKVRESRDNLQHNLRTVCSIAAYLQTSPSDRHASMLLGCTEDDKAHRLKRVPEIIVRELGYNLIPAIDASHLEGAPQSDIATFIWSITPQIDQILSDCNAIQTAISRSIKHEYADLKAGQSALSVTCEDALNIAEQAVRFCEERGLLRAL